MKALQVEYHGDLGGIKPNKDAEKEDWVEVCRRYNDDVHRIGDVTEQDDFTALYECFDEKDNSIYYLVKEDENLFRIKRKHFLKNIGKGQ